MNYLLTQLPNKFNTHQGRSETMVETQYLFSFDGSVFDFSVVTHYYRNTIYSRLIWKNIKLLTAIHPYEGLVGLLAEKADKNSRLSSDQTVREEN